MARSVMGRPCKLDEAMATKAVREIERGAPIEAVAAMIGVSRSTFYDWLRRGVRARLAEEGGEDIPSKERPFAEFYMAIEKARSEWETRQLETIEVASRAGPQYWTAAAWQLERRMPEKYSLKARVDHRHELQIEIGHGPEEVDCIIEGSDEERALPPSPAHAGNGSESRPNPPRPSSPGPMPPLSPPKKQEDDKNVFGPLVWDHPKGA